MKRILLILLMLPQVILVQAKIAVKDTIASTSLKRKYNYDVVVYGGTSAGITTAIQVAKMGKRVALLEPGKHVGGTNVEGLGGTDIDNHSGFRNSIVVSGLALEFYKKLASEYGRLGELEDAIKNGLKKPALWRFEPSVAEKVIVAWLKENSVDIFYEAILSEKANAVQMKNSRIQSVKMLNGKTFFAKVFVDASIEGDLLYRANVSTTIGRESNATYNEIRNGIQGLTKKERLKVDVDPYQVPMNSKSGVIATIKNEALGTVGDGDRRIQAYCFRVCLTNDKSNQIPISKPENFDRKNYEIYIRYLKAGGKLAIPRSNIPNSKTDFNAGGDLSHNLFGMNHSYPGGSYKERGRVIKYHKDFTQGLLYFLTYDKEVGELDPIFQKEWKSWGLAKDEFTDNNGWPRQFYVRDARRMISDYVVTEHHIKKENSIAVLDPVAIAFWPPDIHGVRRIIKDGLIYTEGAVFGGNWWKPFGVSYQSLVPKKMECSNLLTPTCVSSSHIAYGAIRIEWTFMLLGQACGAAAVIAIDEGVDIQDVNYERLKHQLIKDKVVLRL